MTTMAAPQGYYAASTADPVSYPRLRGDVTADICVIGGGFTGLSAALHLAEAGARVVLVEAETVAFAASGRNGGQIHSGQRKDQAELETWLGAAHARALWNLAEEAKALLRSLARDRAIDCDLRDGLVIAAHDAAALRSLEADTQHLRSAYGDTALRMLDRDEITRELGTTLYPGGRFDSGGGHLHPLKFARGLAAAAARAGASLYEHARVRALEQSKDAVTLHMHGHTLRADRVILAADAFTGALVPALAPYIGHVESFIIATAPLPPDLAAQVLPCRAAVADTRHVLDYYRLSADDRMLFAGRESYWTVPSDVARLVRPRMLRVFPALAGLPIEYAWSGTVGITRTRMPHFGRLGERVLFAHGYSGHGVALATLGGKVMADAMLGQTERFGTFARVPAKTFPGGALLRKPLITAGLLWYKIEDAF
jgi:gamma-glutamylputrescine oxidase